MATTRGSNRRHFAPHSVIATAIIQQTVVSERVCFGAVARIAELVVKHFSFGDPLNLPGRSRVRNRSVNGIEG